MNEKQYLISEGELASELRDLISNACQDMRKVAKDILLDKQPVELIASGEVDVQMAMDNPYGDEYTVGEMVLDLDKYSGKHIDIYIKERKE